MPLRSQPAGSRSPVKEQGTSPTEGCKIGELFAMLGQPHMLRILHEFQAAGDAPIRFTELQVRLGISPKTLAHRLRTLVAAGFVARRSYNEIPPRVEYAPSPKTAELNELFSALDKWSRRHSLTAVAMVSTVGSFETPTRASGSGATPVEGAVSVSRRI